jgi:hypothetical protein
MTGSNFPNWLVSDLKLALDVQFPATADGYSWNHNISEATNNYINQIKGFDFWKVTGIQSQMWIAGYTGKETVSSYSTYAGPFDMKEVYQQVEHPDQDKNYYWGSLTPVVFFESDKITFIPAMSWDRGNTSWIAFAPGQVIIKSSHAAVDAYEVFNVPGIVIPTQ